MLLIQGKCTEGKQIFTSSNVPFSFVVNIYWYYSIMWVSL